MSKQKLFAAIVSIFIALFTSALFATTPTVTKTTALVTSKYVVYKYTFTTGISATDGVFLGANSANDRNKSFFDLSALGATVLDSAVTIEIHSDEATADSTRLPLLHQVSLDPSPSAGSFITVATDATTITNASDGVTMFRVRRYAQALRYRLILYENNTSKDATQNFTVRIYVPKR